MYFQPREYISIVVETTIHFTGRQFPVPRSLRAKKAVLSTVCAREVAGGLPPRTVECPLRVRDRASYHLFIPPQLELLDILRPDETDNSRINQTLKETKERALVIRKPPWAISSSPLVSLSSPLGLLHLCLSLPSFILVFLSFCFFLILFHKRGPFFFCSSSLTFCSHSVPSFQPSSSIKWT